MEGLCKCGGRVQEHNHQVTTEAGASKWVEPMISYKLPLDIETSECDSCGRRMTRVFDSDGQFMARNG